MDDNRFISFTNLVSSLNRVIFLIKEEETQKYELKSMHVSCLYNLYRFNALTQVELIELCEENKAAISRTLCYLIDNGYVKIDNPDAKYKKSYSLTKKGIEMSEIIQNRVNSILEKASGSIPVIDRKKMYECLRKIDENLREIITQNNKSR